MAPIKKTTNKKVTTKKPVVKEVKEVKEVTKIEEIEDNKGLGDKVEQLITLFGIKSCKECKTRKQWLNGLFSNKNPNSMTFEELEYFAQVKDNRVLNNDDLIQLEEIYFNVFHFKKKQKICRSCPQVWIDIIKELKIIYKIQINTE